MTTERLKLEIQLEVQKALQDLKSASQDVKKLAQEVKTLGPSSDQTKAIIAHLNKELQSSAKFARLMGNEAQGLKEQQQALQAAMRQLIDQGLDPQGELLQDLKKQYDETATQLQKLGDGASSLEMRLAKLAESGAMSLLARQVAGFAVEAVTAFAQAEQSAKRLEMAMALRGHAEGVERITQFASELQRLTGVSDDLVKQLAAELAMQGKSEAQIRTLITAAADLSAVTGDDLASCVAELSGTLSGMAGRIGRIIPQLKDLTEEQLKAGGAIEIVGQLYAGSAQAMSGTSAVAFKRMRESIGDLLEAIGEGLAPVFTLAANAVSGLASALANAGSFMKGALGTAVAMLTAGLAALALKAGIAAAAQWTHFAALMAVNKALAVTNPLLLAGIAAVAAGTVAVVAYASAQGEAAKAASSGASSHASVSTSFRSTAEAADRARAALESYKESLKDKSVAELQTTLTTLKTKLAEFRSQAAREGGDFASRKVISEVSAQIAVLEALVQQKKDEIAAKWKDAWKETYEAFQRKQSGDPYAEVEYERKKKLEEAAASYIGQANKAVIDQVNAYYDAKRREVAERIAWAEREQLARITETKIDDLELERDRTLKKFQGTEETKQRIAAYYASRIAHVRLEEEQAVSKARIEQEQAAARARLEEEVKTAELQARLTESRLDDLKVQMRRELELSQHTEEQKALIAAYYAEQIRKTEEEEARKAAETRIQEMKRAFEESRRIATQQGQWGAVFAKEFEAQAASTQAGQMAGFAGGVSVDPISMAIQAIVEFALSIENVQKVLNPFKTILEGARKLLEPLINDALQPIVDVLLEIGNALAQSLAPYLTQIALVLRIFSSVLQIALIPARLVGRVFQWLNDTVLVPFGNAVIDLINGVIKAINWALGWLGISIPYLERLKTTQEIAEEEELIKQKMEAISKEMDRVRQTFAEKRKQIEDAYTKNISSLRKLLEIGAMGEAEYDARVASLNIEKEAALAAVATAEAAQLAELQKIYDQLSKGINVNITNLPGQTAPTGSPTAPSAPSFNPYNLVGGAVGAALGSLFGPVGTVVGGALGSQAGGMIEKAADFVGDSVRKGAKWVGKSIKKLKFWDVGTINVPYDMLSMVHKGEMVIPATFAESLRRGEVVLGGNRSGLSSVTNITINVEGSVRTENELVDAIALGIKKRQRQGLLPAGV